MSKKIDKPKKTIEFFLKEKQNREKSVKAGFPVFDKVEMVRVTIGDDKPFENPATETHKQKWKDEYQSFIQKLA